GVAAHRDHPLSAAACDRITAASEARGMAERRRRLLADARGRILEIGAGTGLNLAHYRPENVSSVVALEPDGAMRRRLLDRVGQAPVPCEIHEQSVEDAVFPDGSFDTVVATLVFCTVADPDGVAAAIRRWLVPDGRLLFIEHVRGVGARAAFQRVATPLWTVMPAGCHLDRDTIGALRQAGLFVTDCERFTMPAGRLFIGPCVQGAAQPLPLLQANE